MILSALALGTLIAAGCVTNAPNDLGGGDPGGGDPGGDPGGNGASGPTGGGSDPTGGGGAGGEEPLPQPAVFEVQIAQSAPIMEMRQAIDLTVSVDPKGYVGPVALAIEGLAAGVTGVLEDASVTLDGATMAFTTLTLTTESTTLAGEYPFTVSGTVDTGTKSDTATATVQPVITITIPMNLASYQGQDTAFGPNPTIVRAPTGISQGSPLTIRFFNADTQVHSIHAGNDAQGFPHGGDIPPGQFEQPARQVNATGDFGYYPHDIGQGIPGRIIVQE